MTLWRRWSEWVPRASLVALVLVIGLAAEAGFGGFGNPTVDVPDLLVGVCLAVVGVTLQAIDFVRIGWIVYAAGLAWFAGNLALSSSTSIAWIGRHLALSPRALIFVALFTFPAGGASDRADWALILLPFTVVLSPVSGAGSQWFSIVWASVLLIVFGVVARRRRGLLRPAGLLVLPVVVVFWAVLVVTAASLLVHGARGAPRLIPLVYRGGFVATAAFLLSCAFQWRRRSAEVADAVVEITSGPGGKVNELLARALRDPSVEVIFAAHHGPEQSWVDEAGRPASRLRTQGRFVVPIVLDGDPIAEVGSAIDFSRVPAVFEAVATATGLAAEHARLRARLRQEIELLAASRLRLVEVADRERAELAVELELGTGRSLHQLRGLIDHIPVPHDRTVEDAAHRTLASLDSVDRDLDWLAAGLGPSALSSGDLRTALEQLVDGSDVPVALRVDGPSGELPIAVATTIYFICSEGIANALKHARATHLEVVIERAVEAWRLRIVDDGCGGASVSAGSGLMGLADRVAAHGGSLHLDSPNGAGTRLTVEIPAGPRR